MVSQPSNSGLQGQLDSRARGQEKRSRFREALLDRLNIVFRLQHAFSTNDRDLQHDVCSP